VVELINTWPHEQKLTAARIALRLGRDYDFIIHPRTVGRWFKHLGINRRRHLNPEGSSNRQPGRIMAKEPGATVHIDVKKVGRIADGGGWFAHG